MFVCFFKPEVEEGVEDEPSGLVDTYKQVQRTSALSWIAAAKGCPTLSDKGISKEPWLV